MSDAEAIEQVRSMLWWNTVIINVVGALMVTAIVAVGAVFCYRVEQDTQQKLRASQEVTPTMIQEWESTLAADHYAEIEAQAIRRLGEIGVISSEDADQIARAHVERARQRNR